VEVKPKNYVYESKKPLMLKERYGIDIQFLSLDQFERFFTVLA
jgi:hypothetical protein